MFHHVPKSALSQWQPHAQNAQNSRDSRVSTTLICVTSLAVAGRNSNNTIRCDSGLDDDEFTTRDTKSRKNGLIEQFRRPRWSDGEYQSADTTFASWFPNKKSGIVRCDALIVPAYVLPVSLILTILSYHCLRQRKLRRSAKSKTGLSGRQQ